MYLFLRHNFRKLVCIVKSPTLTSSIAGIKFCNWLFSQINFLANKMWFTVVEYKFLSSRHTKFHWKWEICLSKKGVTEYLNRLYVVKNCLGYSLSSFLLLCCPKWFYQILATRCPMYNINLTSKVPLVSVQKSLSDVSVSFIHRYLDCYFGSTDSENVVGMKTWSMKLLFFRSIGVFWNHHVHVSVEVVRHIVLPLSILLSFRLWHSVFWTCFSKHLDILYEDVYLWVIKQDWVLFCLLIFYGVVLH